MVLTALGIFAAIWEPNEWPEEEDIANLYLACRDIRCGPHVQCALGKRLFDILLAGRGWWLEGRFRHSFQVCRQLVQPRGILATRVAARNTVWWFLADRYVRILCSTEITSLWHIDDDAETEEMVVTCLLQLPGGFKLQVVIKTQLLAYPPPLVPNHEENEEEEDQEGDPEVDPGNDVDERVVEGLDHLLNVVRAVEEN